MLMLNIKRINSLIIEVEIEGLDIAYEFIMIKIALGLIDDAINFGGQAIEGINNQNISNNSKVMVSFALIFQNSHNADNFIAAIKENR